MCLNEFCKSPFESPQWRRGPLGPGTLCNACGTRYARMEAKKKGDKRGAKLRPQDLVEWAAFQEQLQWPLEKTMLQKKKMAVRLTRGQLHSYTSDSQHSLLGTLSGHTKASSSSFALQEKLQGALVTPTPHLFCDFTC
ncbi:hypothetical protein OEZ85_010961 [Tetradesmus obliquus]|uniref:GATA-type domain-containing protein n=1 Tax=Tetradesmus obliquus TaxID=3088 RepID=A0ABY8TQY1_TETOB|nr:hypothetical protein OEZ85_010961 [Tetradesmus obliquus]